MLKFLTFIVETHLEHDSLDIIRLIISFLKTDTGTTRGKKSVKEDAVGSKKTSDFRLV